MRAAPEVSRRPRLDSLTGLRFAAALLVFASHVQELFVGTALEGVAEWVTVPGPSGVSFFFILSGFVLAWSARPGDAPGAFWRRRFARVFPNHAVTWLLAFGVLLLEAPGALRAALPDPGIALETLLLVQAWVPEQEHFYGLNRVSWSLSCEALFYAVFPLVIVLAPRLSATARRVAMAAVVVAAAAIAVVAAGRWDADPVSALWLGYVAPPVRALEFVLGVLLALELRAGRLPRVPLGAALALATAAYVLQSHLPEPARYGALTLVPFALVIVAAAAADLRGRATLWSRRELVVLGELSFAFYLVHQLVLRSFLAIADRDAWAVGPATGASLAVLALSLAAAALLHRGVERPLERRLRGGRDRATAVDV